LLKDGGIKQKSKALSANDHSPFFKDQSTVKVGNLIWSTGFKSGDSRIKLPAIFKEKEMPIHKRGVTDSQGFILFRAPLAI
jgi:putative flavoprotein involved in K+ transport